MAALVNHAEILHETSVTRYQCAAVTPHKPTRAVVVVDSGDSTSDAQIAPCLY